MRQQPKVEERVQCLAHSRMNLYKHEKLHVTSRLKNREIQHTEMVLSDIQLKIAHLP